MTGTEDLRSEQPRSRACSTKPRSAPRTRRPWRPKRGALLLVAALTPILLPDPGIAAPAVAGRYAVVPDDLESTKPRQTRAFVPRAGSNVVIGEKIESGATSAAQLLFGEGAVVNMAPATSLRVAETVPEAADGDGGEPVPMLDLTRGLLRIFVSRACKSVGGIRVSTPAGVVDVVAAEAAVEVLENGSIRVANLGGTGSVHWQDDSATQRDLEPGKQLELAAAAPPDYEAIEASAENEIRRRTEALPTSPQRRPRARRYEDHGPKRSQGLWRIADAPDGDGAGAFPTSGDSEAPGIRTATSSGLCGQVIYNPGAARFSPNPVSTEIRVFDESGALKATRTSDAQGYYEIPLEPGSYRVVLSDYGVVFENVSVADGACLDPRLRINAP